MRQTRGTKERGGAKARRHEGTEAQSFESAGALPTSRIVRLARLLDSRFRIPETRIRFGLDGIIGLIPGVGDVVTAALSMLIIIEAKRLGVSERTLLRMVLNVGIDALIGAVPLIGDLFDIGFKANLRNVALLEKELARGGRAVKAPREAGEGVTR